MTRAFLHAAHVYRGADEYLAATVPFLLDGLAGDEPVAAAVPEPGLRLIEGELGSAAPRVRLIDMGQVGRNPGRIIPGVLRAFADAHPDTRVRIVGEPVWPGRSALEYPACAQHEALINHAFDGRNVAILCPYDADGLDPRILSDATMTHPVIVDRNGRRDSPDFAPDDVIAAYNVDLPDAPNAAAVAFDIDDLGQVRAFAVEHASRIGMAGERLDDVALAVGELAANSIRYGGGSGTLKVWADAGHVVCEVRDGGYIEDRLAGRIPAVPRQVGGYGLLIVNDLADLVRTQTGPAGTAIRLHFTVPSSAPTGHDGRSKFPSNESA
ncbi:MAG TPA: sensor histidine kinase [Jiangellaceae bacterium]|nr:sensor histidine kinase [Jiangellaceae bacterium]